MAERNEQERNLPASPKRLQDAREAGQAPRSRDLASALVLIGMAGTLFAFAPQLLQATKGLLRAGLTLDINTMAPQAMTQRFGALSWEALVVALPVLGVAAVCGIAGFLATGGWLTSTKAFTPDFSRLSPLRGLSNLFSTLALAELGKAILKVALVASAACFAVAAAVPDVLSLNAKPLATALNGGARALGMVMLIVSAALFIVAALDVPLQVWFHRKNLRMTVEEAKQEAKETEGDPKIKGRIRQVQRDMARRRMMSEVPKADVVVVNPQHYAVALSYSATGSGAPRVVAKGVDLIAQRIREIAGGANVPIVSAPPLARSLYRHAEIGDEVPMALYNAVAQVLAYVFHLREFNARGGPAPQAPRDIEIPAELAVEGARV